MITVRPARADDADRILRICIEGWRDAYGGLVPESYIERSIASFYGHDRILREIEDHDGWTGWFVAEDGEHMLGAAAGGIARSGAAELYVLYVDPKRRDEGAGTALLDEISDLLAAEGATEIWVSVVKGNEKGIPFYRARGFEVMYEERAHDSRADENVIALRMRRQLPTAGDRSV
jgi:ribosomal protein S18 acetylase RimI-like enzyme